MPFLPSGDRSAVALPTEAGPGPDGRPASALIGGRKLPGERCAGHRHQFRWLGVDLSEWHCNLLQRFAFGVDPERDLAQSANDHDAAADEVPDGEPGAAGAIADQRAVESGPARADDLGNREEPRQGSCPYLDGEDLA